MHELSNKEYESCLRKMQAYIDANKGREAKKYERGAGVRELNDRGGSGERYGTDRERYNGRGGGRVFKWYSRAVFNNYLSRMGTSEEGCSERQCMLALAATSDELKKYPMLLDRLVAYAGPQCFPHLDPASSDYRARANQRLKEEQGDGPCAPSRVDAADRGGGAGAVGATACWMQCEGCKKWRCVADRDTYPKTRPHRKKPMHDCRVRE